MAPSYVASPCGRCFQAFQTLCVQRPFCQGWRKWLQLPDIKRREVEEGIRSANNPVIQVEMTVNVPLALRLVLLRGGDMKNNKGI